MSAESDVVALRSGTAAWMGDGKEGFGFISTESGALQSHPYSVDSRFHNAAGTSPEELIAAAYASSFVMYLALLSAQAGYPVAHMDATALVTLQANTQGFSIPRLHLVLTASVPDIDNATFQSIAARAKANCAVSRLLTANISLDAKLTDRNAVVGLGPAR